MVMESYDDFVEEQEGNDSSSSDEEEEDEVHLNILYAFVQWLDQA